MSAVAYATASQLVSLGEYLAKLSDLTRETGWHAPSLMVSCGAVEGEEIVVGVRWSNNQYLAEIR